MEAQLKHREHAAHVASSPPCGRACFRTPRFAFIPELFALATNADEDEDNLEASVSPVRAFQNGEASHRRTRASNVSVARSQRDTQSVSSPHSQSPYIQSCSPQQSASLYNSVDEYDETTLARWGLFLGSHPSSSYSQILSNGYESNSQSSAIHPVQPDNETFIFKSLGEEVQLHAENYVKELQRRQAENEIKRKLQQDQKIKEENVQRELREKEKLEQEVKRREEQFEADRRKKEEEEKKIKEQEKLEKEAATIVPPSSLPPVLPPSTDDFETKRAAKVDEWKSYMQNGFQQIRNDTRPEIKQFRIETKKTINLIVNQLASTSSQIELVSGRLLALLDQTSPTTFASSQAYQFKIISILNCLLDNAEIQLVSNPKSVWSYGMLLSRLCEVPQFFSLLTAALDSRCLYCVPNYVTKTKSMSQSQFELLRGQKEAETELVYFLRMSAVLRLWLVCIVCMKDRNLYWMWWSRFLNLKPKRISPFLLSTALESSGFFGCQSFPKQFQKLINISIVQHFIPKLKSLQTKDTEGTLSAAMTQISIILDEYKKSNRLALPDGFHLKKMAEDINSNI